MLTYDGFMYVPNQVDQYAQGSLGVRPHADGSHSFFVVGDVNLGNGLFEFNDVGFSVGNPKTATLIRNWGVAPYGSAKNQAGNTSHLVVEGLYFVDENHLLWMFGNNYDVGTGIKAFLGMSVFNGDTVEGLGPWLPSVPQSRVRQFCVGLPGGKLGFGSGIVSGSSACSWGPDLYSANLDVNNPPAPNSTIELSELLFYPDAARKSRNADYVIYNGDGTLAPKGTTLFKPGGLWTAADNVRCAALIGDTVLFGASQVFGAVWYGNSPMPNGITDHSGNAKGQRGEGHRAQWWAYALGSNPPLMQLMDTFDVRTRYPNFGPLHPNQEVNGMGVLGNHLYVAGRNAYQTRPVIHRFTIS